ncbi:hypothetical protein Mal15_02700 [Stieleria maiorica]|uniref:Translational regulator CsrA n=1 Tax=Stieleria maiorica TaxID=2795974 RepID=A0A5B9M6G1_9BACT|nr:response regulator [Stieleria maiorica]QEF96243.1 hypothetical protein Mal15_02700 [Stieleria maiorica]
MLVLSRRTKDKVSFPQVGVTVHFIRVQSGQVKIGIDAPRSITIVRDEVSDGDAIAEMVRRQIAQLPQETRHGIRNELHEITVGLHLYRELIRAGINDEAEETFDSLQESLKRLDSNEAFRRPDAPPVTDPDRETIALIEDSANERRMLAEVLQLKGYQVLEFSNGANALQHFEDNDAPGLVLVDMNMPELDGHQTVTMMRQSERFRDVPIFAVSGTSPEENDLVMGRQGVDRWLPKPLSLETLMNSIRQAIGAPKAKQPTQALRNEAPLSLSRVPSVAADLA